MSDATEKPNFEGWAILELMGHRKLAGYVREVEVFGAPMCRLDVPAGDGRGEVTQYYSASAIYCLTPTTEELAMKMAAGFRPEPVHRYELPAPPVPTRRRSRADEWDDTDDDEDPGDETGGKQVISGEGEPY